MSDPVSRTETETAALRALAEKAVAADDGIAPDLYRELSPDVVLRLLDENAALSVALEAALEHLRDRAVCSGCGQDVSESGACDTAGCDSGEMIPAGDLPSALHAAMELRNDVRVDTNEELEAARQETAAAQSYSDADTQTAAAMASRATLAEEKLRKTASEFQGIFDKWQAAESELAGLRETVGALREALERIAEGPGTNSDHRRNAAAALARLRGSQENTRG